MEKNNNYISKTNGFSNSEMYNMSRNGAIESVGFWTADIVYIKEKTTFAKAPNGAIASLCDWYDNGATYYEKVDGRWFELDAERAEAIKAELRERGRKMVEAAKKEMNEANIANSLKADLAKLDPEREDVIDEHVIGNFCVITEGSGKEMYVRLVLHHGSNYIDGLYEPFEMMWSTSSDEYCEEIAEEIADYIANIADEVFFELFSCYKDTAGRIWQLEAVRPRGERNDYECTLVSVGKEDEEVVYASMGQAATSISFYDEGLDDNVYIEPTDRVEL